jgi:hypothetical protein
MGTEGKYLILGLAGAGKRTLLEHLAIGDVVKSDDGKVSSITYKGIELHVSHIRRRRRLLNGTWLVLRAPPAVAAAAAATRALCGPHTLAVCVQAWNLGGKDYRGDLGYSEETAGVTGIMFMVDSAGACQPSERASQERQLLRCASAAARTLKGR